MKISVIIPVYNAEKYLKRCIDSVCNQTYSNWEIIMVDDGSTDGSWKIMSEYSCKSDKIKVFSQENLGAGLARNKAMNYLNGEYVVFLDADDYLESNYFEQLSSHNEDVVFIDANRRNEKGDIVTVEKISANKRKSKDSILRKQMTGKTPWGGWRKAVKSSLIRQYNLKYTEHKVGEEAVFSFLLLFYAENFSFIDVPVYNYEVHSGSLSQTLVDDPWGDVAMAMKNMLKEMGVYNDYTNTVNSFIKTAAIVSLKNMAKKYTYMQYCSLAKERIKQMNKEVDFSKGTDYRNMDMRAILLLPFIKCGMYNMIYFASKLIK